MDRAFWLSILAVLVSLAVLFTGRAVLEGATTMHGADLVSRIESLEGQPSTVELADEVTEAAGCVRGNRPKVRSCWYVWVHPERPDYLMVTARHVLDDGIEATLGWAIPAAILWLLAIPVLWKSTRPRSAYHHSPIPTRMHTETPPSEVSP